MNSVLGFCVSPRPTRARAFVRAEARKRVDELRKTGKSIEADELLALCNLADAGARLRPGVVEEASWEQVKTDFVAIAASEFYDLVPWDMKLSVTRRVVKENCVGKQYKTWARRVWLPPQVAGSSPGGGGPSSSGPSRMHGMLPSWQICSPPSPSPLLI